MRDAEQASHDVVVSPTKVEYREVKLAEYLERADGRLQRGLERVVPRGERGPEAGEEVSR
jgi:hypothetical protein